MEKDGGGVYSILSSKISSIIDSGPGAAGKPTTFVLARRMHEMSSLVVS